MRRSVEQGSDARTRTRDDDAIASPRELGQILIRDELITPARRNDNVEPRCDARAGELRRRRRQCRDHGVVANDDSCSRTACPVSRIRSSCIVRGGFVVFCVHATNSAHTVGKLHHGSG
jgi:hypothetical protein